MSTIKDNDNEIMDLVSFKFHIQQECEMITKKIAETKELKLQSLDNITNTDITSIYVKYYNESLYNNHHYMEKLNVTMLQIDALLMKKCEHEWTNDVYDEPLSSKFITYCSNCCIYKKCVTVPEY